MLDCLLGGSSWFERRSPFHYVGLCHFTAAHPGPPFSSRAGSGHPRGATRIVLWLLCSSALPSIGHRAIKEQSLLEQTSIVYLLLPSMQWAHTLAFSLLWPVKKWKPIFTLLPGEYEKAERKDFFPSTFGVAEQMIHAWWSLTQTERARLKIQFSWVI